MTFHVCWSIDCESCRKDVNDLELGRRSIEGFCEILNDNGWKSTLFLMPEEIGSLADLLYKKAEEGHELGLHLHPEESGYRSDYLGVYSRNEQIEIISKSIETFEKVLGIPPISIRSGYGSANDFTFSVLQELGFKQCSMSFPGRKMSNIASNWAGAPLFAHYANPNNRFLENGLDLVEIPISVDWETMIWGGIHPQDLRVEFTDAKNHGFLIRKIMKHQVINKHSFQAILPFTHNIFDFSEEGNFRRQTMKGMIEEIHKIEREFNLKLNGSTLYEAALDYRSSNPLY